MRDTFLLKTSWQSVFEDLNDRQAGVLIKAVYKYISIGEKPELMDLEVKMAFKFISLDIDVFQKNYDKRCETSRKNGTLGGRPKKAENQYDKKPKKPNEKPNKPKKPYNDNDNDNDNKELIDINSNFLIDIKKYIPQEKTEIETRFNKFQQWIKDNASNVSKMKEPFTIEEFERLINDFDMDKITNILSSMHNWKPLLTKNLNANKTFRIWEKKQQ